MQKKMSARIAGWLALTLAAALAVTSVPVMSAHAAGTDAKIGDTPTHGFWKYTNIMKKNRYFCKIHLAYLNETC